jgi:hypothetical protein
MISEENLEKFNSMYSDKLPKQLIAWCSEGKSIEAFAAHINCIPQVFPIWCRSHQDFEIAVHVGYWKRYAFWEGKAIDGVHDRMFNTPLYALIMRQSFKWNDLKNTITEDIKGMSDKELEDRVKHILKAPRRQRTIEMEGVDD